MTEFVWASPGGTYRVPSGFKSRFLSEFPTYRIRWSLKQSQWLVEQQIGSGALPPINIDPFDDSMIRARDGYWLVMMFRPGTRMACPTCGLDMSVALCKTAESTCLPCKSRKRDARVMTGYWPFDERLIEHLRRTDPLRGGIMKDTSGKLRVRASVDADRANQRMQDRAEAKRKDASTLDAVDYRWISGIPTAGATRRQLDTKDFA